ncbi:MAG: acyl-CoA thioesterase [Acidimicrobiia bacterium]|nr:acyl-CoA thioesterase [Acidimicrobiia bacterium]
MPFEHAVPVRWGELDPYNHLNHAVYFSYCEAARIAMLEEAGFGMATLEDAGYRIVVTETHARFLRSATEGQVLAITTELHEGRRASATWRQVITTDDEEIFEMLVTAAFTNLDGRPTRAPEGFLDAMESA